MDKFGIFKLLSTISKLYNGAFPSPNAQNADFSANEQPSLPPQEPSVDYLKSPSHISSPMLDTMKNHDEFVNRVLNKHNK